MTFHQNIIALVYDFDGTLSPLPMQEYTVLPELGIQADNFWKEVDVKANQEKSERMLTYMRLLLEKAEEKKLHIGKNDFTELGKKVEYFKGVDSWFHRLDDYIKTLQSDIKIEHYVISAGMREILDGISIRQHFTEVFASEYFYDHHGIPRFPKLLVNDTSKTQFLFRINKGKLDIRESINTHMPANERRIPFSNILFIGDGLTDVPGMSLTRKQGGYALAVYKDDKGLHTCKDLFNHNRVDLYAPADYSTESILEKQVKQIINVMAANISLQREIFYLSLKF